VLLQSPRKNKEAINKLLIEFCFLGSPFLAENLFGVNNLSLWQKQPPFLVVRNAAIRLRNGWVDVPNAVHGTVLQKRATSP
jgi:hypothetical protein